MRSLLIVLLALSLTGIGRPGDVSSISLATVASAFLCRLGVPMQRDPPVAPRNAIRVLPLGDSITQGGRNDREEYTYRYPLYFALRKAGYTVDFIGSLRRGLHADARWPDSPDGGAFDTDHEGHYGWRTAQVRDKLAEWSRAYALPPDIVLIHLGTNDQSATDFDADIVRPLREIVRILRVSNPKVVVLIGHLNFNGGAALKIRPLVEKFAESTSTSDSPVKTVAHYVGWHEDPAHPDTDTFDWAHPNPRGQKKMADKWQAAMLPYLNRLRSERDSALLPPPTR